MTATVGVKDVHDIDDAALGAGVYLCASAIDLADPAQLRGAVLRYNHSDAYVDTVLGIMAAYAAAPPNTLPNAVAPPPVPVVPLSEVPVEPASPEAPIEPSPSPTSSPAESSSAEPSPTPSPTESPSPTASPTPTPSPTETPTPDGDGPSDPARQPHKYPHPHSMIVTTPRRPHCVY